MSSTRYGFAASRKRLVVLSGAELLTVATLVIVACWLVFPRDLSSVLRHSARVDGVTLSYMRSWLAAKPDDYGLRLVLAKALINHGEFSAATEQLDLVAAAKAAEYEPRLRWLRLNMAFTQLMAVSPSQRRGSPWWPVSTNALSLVDIGELDTPQRVSYAEMSLALGDAESALAVYRALARADSESQAWYVRLAEVLLSQGRYQDAADTYIEAMRATSDGVLRKRYFLLAINALEAGNMQREALRLAGIEEQFFRDDSDVLFRLMKLAQAVGDLALAQHYATQLLRLTPPEGEGE